MTEGLIALAAALVAWVALYMAYRGSYKFAALLASFVAVLVVVESNSRKTAPAMHSALASAATAATTPKRPRDPGPTSATEIAFEAAARLCASGSDCLRIAFETAFGSTCRAMMQPGLRYDYRFHPDEPTFQNVAIVTKRDYEATGASLFTQDATSGVSKRRAWVCRASRQDASGTRSPAYSVMSYAL
jgi:hypothetical protein